MVSDLKGVFLSPAVEWEKGLAWCVRWMCWGTQQCNVLGLVL